MEEGNGDDEKNERDGGNKRIKRARKHEGKDRGVEKGYKKEKGEMERREGGIERIHQRVGKKNEEHGAKGDKEREEGGKGGRREKEEKVVAERVKKIERRMERKEKQERKKKMIIKGMKVREGSRSEAVEKVFERIDARVRIDEVKKLGKGEGLMETIWVRLESKEQKKEVMGRKGRLKGRKEKILEN